MIDFHLSTPVAFLIFNRPDTTARVFEEIRRARPPKLLIVADGPRANRPDDVAKCAATRSIVTNIDWDCEVLTNYSEVNLGCRQRVSSGLSWVFDNVPEAIILEDDCLPHSAFFRFCEEMLTLFREDEQIMHISGVNFQPAQARLTRSYYYSLYPHVWGWASWRRAWKYYDVDMCKWKSAKQKDIFLRRFGLLQEKIFWKWIWNETSKNNINTWDYQWGFACIASGFLCVTPNVNLVSNIGFGVSATHTKMNSLIANLPTKMMSFPLNHPSQKSIDKHADDLIRRLFYIGPTPIRQLAIKFKRRLVSFIKFR